MAQIQRKLGISITTIITVLGAIGSVVSLVATDDQLDHNTKQILVIVGGIISIVGNTISSITGVLTQHPAAGEEHERV